MLSSPVPRKILGVIPARFASSRFPGKVLARIGSKTMLQHVYERASQARYLTSTIIATDDERVFEVARSFGARVRMTRPDHLSGTDRVAEVASAEDAELVVNIQGDEPLIDPAAIDAAILPLAHDSAIVMGTLKKRIEDPREIGRSERGQGGHRPRRRRDILFALPNSLSPGSGIRPPAHYKHIGLYVYRRDFLLDYSALPVGPLERAERLEQLRAMENGYSIRVVETEYESMGVDTPEDSSG